MKGFLSRLGAMYLIAVPGAFLIKLLNKYTLAQLGGDPVAYVAHRKELIMRSGPGMNFLALVLLGMPLIALVEVVAYVIRGGWRESKKNSLQ